MSENSELQKLNPQITEIEIGIRELRKVKVYPLSMADQLKLTDTITKAIAEQAHMLGQDIAVIAFIVKIIQENLGTVLSMATDEDGNAMLSEISNLQAAAIAGTVYETNYGIVVKNFNGLFGKLKALFLSERLLPLSVSDTDTVSKTSTESPGETEALPSDS